MPPRPKIACTLTAWTGSKGPFRRPVFPGFYSRARPWPIRFTSSPRCAPWPTWTSGCVQRSCPRPPALQLLSGGAIRFYRPEWRQGLVKLHRSAFPGWWLRRFVSPESVLGGIDLRNSRARYLLLLALVDRPRDMLYLLWRTVWPERAWLAARYQNQSGRGRHLWLLCQGTI